MIETQYIHFEGMDLAGKTTATENFIASQEGVWEIRHNSLIHNNPIYLLANELRLSDAYDAEILGNLYIAALMVDIRHFQQPTNNTIQDSTILLRSLAYHTISGTPRISQVLLDIIPQHPKFNASFIFTADLETRLHRLQKRMKYHPDQVASDDLMVVKNPEKFMAMEACLIDMAKGIFHSVIIDTSRLTPDAVIGTIKSNLHDSK